ncbi:MAG: hypothetical protein IH614_14795, partial [Desulfuromonadales bacterium]|nr:hypothetical protein [Desulfuromonadales bacterium]
MLEPANRRIVTSIMADEDLSLLKIDKGASPPPRRRRRRLLWGVLLLLLLLPLLWWSGLLTPA